MLGNFWKLYAGKFFGSYMLGNFLETTCWLPRDGNYVLGNSGGCRWLYGGVIMTQCYGNTLRFDGNGTQSAS